jgi:predicted alternative tryptophan synthase beta-subunit
MTSHLQQLLDDAMKTEILPLGEAIEDAVGGLTDEQRHVVAGGLQQAVMVGLRVAFVEAAAQLEEQGVQIDLVLALEADAGPPQ